MGLGWSGGCFLWHMQRNYCGAVVVVVVVVEVAVVVVVVVEVAVVEMPLVSYIKNTSSHL